MTWVRGKFSGDGYEGEWVHDAIHGHGACPCLEEASMICLLTFLPISNTLQEYMTCNS